MPMKTFRGQVDSGGQETISLHTNDGLTGYKIAKFKCIPDTPGVNQTEAIVKVYTVEQDSVDAVVDFDDQTLIGVVFLAVANGSNEAYASELHTVFDNITFNQDIYVTGIELAGGRTTNYHIELEQVRLNVNEQTVATLKDIRNTGSQ
tara:strand:- start:33 stop:476 length:444 start_codon:yes stop_codon:yes gene_type:complete